jgi:hypothetical protein
VASGFEYIPVEKLLFMKLLPNSYVFIDEDNVKLMWRTNRMTMTVQKQPPLLEDLRNHSQEQVSELRLLLNSGAPLRADARRPGFFEVDGDTNVFYIFKYPTGTKVLLLGIWERDRVAEMAACAYNAA